MAMADIGSSAKSVFMKAMEGISSAASSLASNTRFRIDEMNLTNQRRELLEGFGAKAYELFKTGASLPPELQEIMEQVARLDKQLDDIRAERANAAEEKAPERAPSLEVPETEEAAPEKAVFGETDDAVPVMDVPDEAETPLAEAVRETAQAAQEAVESSREAAEKLTGILDEIKNDEA